MRATKELDAAAVAAAEEAHGYLGGLTARSARRDSALLARYRQISHELLITMLEKIGSVLTEENTEDANAILLDGINSIKDVAKAGIACARLLARYDCLSELGLPADLSPDSLSQSREQELLDFGDIEGLMERFRRDLSKAIKQRFRRAAVLDEEAVVAAASLVESNVLGLSLASSFNSRLSTIMGSEWTLEANRVRRSLLVEAALVLPRLLVKYLYFDRALCDGSCLSYASGGPFGQGVYRIDDAPMPILDTHPNCRCLLAPWMEWRNIANARWVEEDKGIVHLTGELEWLDPFLAPDVKRWIVKVMLWYVRTRNNR